MPTLPRSRRGQVPVRLARRALLVLFAGLQASQLAAAPKPCELQPNAAVPQLRTLMQSVRTSRYPEILSAVEAAWSGEATFGAGKPDALVRLGRLSLHGEGFRELRICTEGPTIAAGEYRNDFTGMVDEVRVRVAEDSRASVTRVQVRPAVRAAEHVAAPSSDSARLRRLDQFMRRLLERDAFSGTVVVARRGAPIYARAFGFANRALGTRNQVTTQYNLASLSKIMTAVIVLQLVEQKRLSLDDRIASLLPERTGGEDFRLVQVKHLLSHTSGIGDSLERLEFAPGSRHQYSNFNFTLLGEVIEKVTKMRFEDALAVRILGPAEMANTRRYEIRELSPDVTQGYTFEHLGDPAQAPRDALRLTANHYLHIYPGGSMGALWSSAPDLLRFATALTEGRLLKPETLELMRAPKPELGSTDYGYGVMLSRAPGAWGHAGDLPGADADLEIHGDIEFIVLANADNVNEPVMRMLRELFPDRRVPTSIEARR